MRLIDADKLIDNYRASSGTIPFNEAGLFELKECVNDKSGWKGTQTLITPKGQETFQLLFASGA